MLVYQLRNRVTGMSYIGATQRPLSQRLSNHRSFAAKGLLYPLAQAIRDNGWDAFDVIELAHPKTKAEMYEMEKAAIILHRTMTPNGYNLMAGGTGSGPKSAAAREKVSKALKGRMPWITGKHHSHTTRVKLSMLRRGGLNATARPLEYNGVIYPSMLEASQATGLSRAQLYRRVALGMAVRLGEPKHAPGIGKWNKGRVASDETRKAQSAARKGYRNWNARAIEYEGQAYPSIEDAVAATGMSRMQFKTRLKNGTAQYLTQSKKIIRGD